MEDNLIKTINEMPAGRLLDDFVSVKRGDTPGQVYGSDPYSTDFSFAWRLLNQPLKWDFTLCYDGDYGEYCCDLMTDNNNFVAWANTPELAICRAFLLVE
jgi:hypothetical protein